MKIIPLKDYKWSIDFKAIVFMKDKEKEVIDNSIAKEMINLGYAKDATEEEAEDETEEEAEDETEEEAEDETEEEAVDKKTKETLVEEKKVIESTEENKKAQTFAEKVQEKISLPKKKRKSKK